MLNAETLAKLATPFPVEDLEFRAIQYSKDGTKAIAFAYINPRAVMDRLDEVFPGGWETNIENMTPMVAGVMPTKAVIRCNLSVAGSDAWITRSGIGEQDIHYEKGDGWNIKNEPWKSAESDALKRAAVQFGVGRYLYSLPAIWIPIDQYKNFTVSPAEMMFNADGSVKASAEAMDTKQARKGRSKAAPKSATPPTTALPGAPTVSAPAPVAPTPVSGTSEPEADVFAGIPEHPKSPNFVPPAQTAPAAPVAQPTVAPPTAAAKAAPSGDQILQTQVNWLAKIYSANGMEMPQEILGWTKEQANAFMLQAIQGGGNTNSLSVAQVGLISNLCSQIGQEIPDEIASYDKGGASRKIQELMVEANKLKKAG